MPGSLCFDLGKVRFASSVMLLINSTVKKKRKKEPDIFLSALIYFTSTNYFTVAIVGMGLVQCEEDVGMT